MHIASKLLQTVIFVLLLVSALASITRAQVKDRNEFGFWGGGSFHPSTIIGKTEDAKLGIIGLRYARIIFDRSSLSLKYTLDAIPVAVLNYPKVEFFRTGPNPPDIISKRTRPSVYGAGLAPIGLQLNFRPRGRVQPFVSTSGGFIYFSDPIPTRLGTQFNFTAELGGGIQVFTSSNRAVTIGYKYHHISNGYRGEVNPGFDSNVFYGGYSIFK